MKETMMNDDSLPAVPERRPPVPMLHTLEDQLRFAAVVVKAGLAGHHKSPESVVIALQMGAELGLMPTQALRMVNVINGKASLNADGTVAVILGSDKAEYFYPEEVTAAQATFVTKRRGSPREVRYTFTMAQAKAAKLPERNPTYQTHPERMLAARAKAFLGRDVYPDVVGGLISEEEVIDLDPTPAPDAPAPIALPRRVGEAPPAETSPNGDADAPAPEPTTGEVLMADKERQALLKTCNRHGKSYPQLKAWLETQGVVSTTAIPARLAAAATAWAEGRAEA